MQSGTNPLVCQAKCALGILACSTRVHLLAMTKLNYLDMIVNQIYEYNTHSKDFSKRTCRRVIFEVFSLVLLGTFFWSNWSNELPRWLGFSMLSIFSAYILLGLAHYPKAKAIAERFSVSLTSNALGFPDQGHMREILYSDLKISKVIKKNGEIIEIHLKTGFDQTTKLRKYE